MKALTNDNDNFYNDLGTYVIKKSCSYPKNCKR